jgi:hypothetical protein
MATYFLDSPKQVFSPEVSCPTAFSLLPLSAAETPLRLDKLRPNAQESKVPQLLDVDVVFLADQQVMCGYRVSIQGLLA